MLQNNRPCRFCGTQLSVTFADLGMSPPSNAFLLPQQTVSMERFFPLHAFVCTSCLLVQLEEFESPDDIFRDYAYFSSFSDSWLAHCKRYAGNITERLGLTGDHVVVEVASNDGYLLQYFKDLGVGILGIEPARNVAEIAINKGIPTVTEFFGQSLAEELKASGTAADLLCGNNVLAHVPNLNDFIEGVRILLKRGGTATFEFPHLLALMKYNQFDTIYHEHFSYFSILALEKIFSAHGMQIVDIDEIPTHGGSLRIYVQHDGVSSPGPNVARVLAAERDFGLDNIKTYEQFTERVNKTKRSFLSFLIKAKDDGKTVAAYGAAAKGTTLLNYCGVRTDLIDYIVDRNDYKQGRFLPGCHIPIYDPSKIFETKPDYVVILPWNIRDEISQQMAGISEWGGRFVTPVPAVEVL